jgi:AcrR family transcriptional regulator
MTRMSADDRRTQLVAAAIRVLAREGVARTTTRAIVAEAGMQLGAFHYCFQSKEELLLAVIEAINDQHIQAIMEVVEPGRGLRATIDAALRAYWEDLQRRPGDYQMAYELCQHALRRPGLAAAARSQHKRFIDVTSHHLEAVAKDTRAEWTVPVPQLARYVHNVLDGATLTWIVDRDRAAALAVIAQLGEHLAGCARTTVDLDA